MKNYTANQLRNMIDKCDDPKLKSSLQKKLSALKKNTKVNKDGED